MISPERPTVLLTGGTGFIGRRLAPSLARLFPDHQRLMVVRGDAEMQDETWRRVALDLADERALEALIARAKPSVLVHLAAESAFGAATATDAAGMWSLNFGATFALGRAIARHAPECMVLFTSTAQVYGAGFPAGPVNEDVPASPLTSYAMSKLAAERALQDVLSPSNQLVVTRAFNQCGPEQAASFVLPSFAEQVARAELGLGATVIEVGNLDVERDFLHVDDAVEAYWRLIAMRRNLARVTIVNVASGKAWKLRAVLDMFLDAATRPIEVRVDPRRVRLSDPPTMVGDATRLRELTGWAPRFGMEDIVRDLLVSRRSAARATPPVT